MNVLVVEDEAQIASFLAKGLSRQGFAVALASLGTEALACLEVSQVDLVLLDLGLPDLDGLEVLRRLRQRGDTTPVLILSARVQPEDRARGLELGAADYLVKPVPFPELVRTIEACLA